MHVLSSAQAEAVLAKRGESLGRRWFSGRQRLRRSDRTARGFEKTCATESSSGMAARLRERGFNALSCG